MDAWGTQGIGRGEEEDAVGLEGVMQGWGDKLRGLVGGSRTVSDKVSENYQPPA